MSAFGVFPEDNRLQIAADGGQTGKGFFFA
jgi:hypothetical protein